MGNTDHIHQPSLTLSQTTNLRLSQMKEYAGDFKHCENGRKFSKQVENTEGKGETAR